MGDLLKSFTFSLHSKPTNLIVMLHGYGDTAENFINIANFLDKEEWGAYYISLNAPKIIPNYPIGNQWFDIYPNAKHISEAGPNEFNVIQKEIKVSIKLIESTINFKLEELGLNYNKCIVLGFSQGGIMVFELGNYSKKKFGGLAVLSGRIIEKKTIKNEIIKQTPIFISHGDQDKVLPINNFYKTINFLRKNNFKFESHEIKGDTHTISAKAMTLLQKFIKKNL